MSIVMDEEAKKKVSMDKLPGQQYSILNEGWICFIESVRITKNLTNTLQTHLNGPILLNHWATSQWYKPGVEKMIDWEMADKTINTLPKAKQQWVSKLAAKFLPYGKTCSSGNYKLKPNADDVSVQAKTKTISCAVLQNRR